MAKAPAAPKIGTPDTSAIKVVRMGTSLSYSHVISLPERAVAFQAIERGGSPARYSRMPKSSEETPGRLNRWCPRQQLNIVAFNVFDR